VTLGETEDSVTHPWHPCPEPEARQGRRGGKDHGVQTGKIRFSSDREECDISVTVLIICINGHCERWRGGEVEKWVLSTTPGQPKGERETS
jgi:hypothetical protein